MPKIARWLMWTGAGAASFVICASLADPLPPSASYRQLPTLPFAAVKANDEAEKPQVTQEHQGVLNQRYYRKRKQIWL